ncbi:hypothetical protein ABEW61_11075 [Paenibacillus amylolyticus]
MNEREESKTGMEGEPADPDVDAGDQLNIVCRARITSAISSSG